VPDFRPSHYNKLIYTKTGLTQRVRPDLTGPDGRPGIDLRGYTVKNHYREMSKGAYDITGGVAGWVQVPHSEAYYGATPCGQAIQANTGHPDNPRQVGQLVVDAVDALAASDPSFPWADYDIEDQGDVDGDGNLFEPDGVIDHFVIIHAGADKADDGGAEGTYAIWSHASNVDPATGGYAVPGTGVKVNNYIMQAEDAGVGVVSHEFGHDLGLPDLYDTSGAAESDVDFWDLMSSGSHTGPLFQSIPVHMGLWDKYVLGWADPETFGVGSSARDVKVGQTSRTPKGTEDGIRVNLPQKTVTLATPHSGENMWYSNNDQSWADVKLSRTLEVPAGDDVRFWSWDNYDIEELWDYGFIEVSTDGGSTWTQLEVRDEAGNVVSTNDDPNGRLHDYGGLQNGLTGSTGGEWRHDYVNLTPYAGSTIGLRLATPPTPPSRRRAGSPTTSRSPPPGPRPSPTTSRAAPTAGRPRRAPSPTPPAPAGSSPAAPSSTSTTTWPSGATTTASTRACATPTTPPTSTSAGSGESPAPPTTPPACWSGTATPSTP
jgi:immune inhibitor A